MPKSKYQMAKPAPKKNTPNTAGEPKKRKAVPATPKAMKRKKGNG